MAAIDTLLATQRGPNILGAINQGIQVSNLQELDRLKLSQAQQQAPLQNQLLQNQLQQQGQRFSQGQQNLALGEQRLQQGQQSISAEERRADEQKILRFSVLINENTTPEDFQNIVNQSDFLTPSDKQLALQFGAKGTLGIAQQIIGNKGLGNSIQSSKINADGSAIVVRRNGVVETISADDVARGVLEDARDFDTQAAQDTAQAKELGSSAAKFADEAFKQVANITRNITNLKDVIKVVEVDGADTGPLAKRLPSIRSAALKLDNIAGRLGLDLISGVTFGALSEGELKFAIDTALPKGLQGPDLVKWAKERINAQEKLSAYLNEAAQFTSKTGNTVADFMAKKQTEKDARDTKSAQAQQSTSQPFTVGRFQIETIN